jgi:predicted ATPase
MFAYTPLLTLGFTLALLKQWCDENSCRLLAQIVNDESIHNFLFIGCYRDELESNVNVNFLHHIDTSRSTFTDVPLGRLNASDVDRLVGMVLDTTSSSSSDHNNQLSRGISNVSSVSSRNIDDSGDLDSCSQLTQLVHRKTLGNPYFVVQFLEMLHARELLTYNYITMKWTWRLSEIAANTSVASNVVDVVTERIARLAPQVQRILIVAAFLGFVVNVQLLEHLIQEFGVMDRLRILQEQDGEQLLESELTTAEALKLASIEGLIELSGPNICRFSHDKIQESFCALVPAKKEQDRLHYQIGMNIWQRYRETDPAFIFLAADQLNRGAGHVVHDADRLFLIEINYKASLAAKSKVGIDTVGMFIEKAIEHASVNSTGYWEKSYELLVNVYSFGAEVECSRGAFNKSEEYSNTILRFSKHTNDTIRALVPRALAHGVKRDFLLGIKESRKILKLLGVKMLPSSTFGFLTEVLRTKSALKKKTDGDILGMKNMESDTMIRAMKILQHGSIFGWNSDTTFAGLCYLKMIRLTVEHGWCAVTPYALSGYGFLLASLGSEQEAFRFSQLALHSTKSRTAQPDVNMMVHTFLAHFQRPASQSLQPLLAGYRSGLETGDMMCGTICMCCYAHVYLFCGLPLKSFSLDMQQFAQQLKLCHQDLALAFLLPALQLALNLSGATADPMDVSRESMERDLDAYNDKMFIDTAVEDPSLLFVFYLQAFSAYLLDDLDLAERALERVFARQKKRLAGTQILNIFFTLVDGLVGFALCRRKPTYKYRKLTRASIKELENLTKRQSINCVGIMCLLQAENASYGGQGTELVKEKYNSVS